MTMKNLTSIALLVDNFFEEILHCEFMKGVVGSPQGCKGRIGKFRKGR